MKEFSKKLYAWCVKLLQSVVSLLSVLFFSSRRCARILSRLAAKGTGEQPCVILANGPSLNKSIERYGDGLSRYKKVAVNMFCATPMFQKMRPDYYVLADPFFFSDAEPEEWRAHQREDIVRAMSEVSWEMTLLLPSINRGSRLASRITNDKLHVVYYNLTPVEGFLSLQHCLFRKNLGMPISMNVLCASLFLMINLGYQEVYLLGADHSWIESMFVNDNNQLVLGDRHFYGTKQIISDKTLSQELGCQSQCFRTHERLAEYARLRHCKVWNATPESFIDAYDRKLLEEK